MPKLKSPETFVANEVLTAADLQNHVDGAFPVPGFISEQTTVDAITTGDQFIINDVSTGALRKVTFGNMLTANQPITASTITSGVYNAPATKDVVIGPIDGANVTGRVFTSLNGILVTVDHVAHGLVTGQNVTITASVPAYSGFYTITVNSVDAFTYSIVPTTPATPPASGTCSYRKEGTVLVNGNISTIENLNANGSLSVGGTFRLNGAGYIGGNLQLPAVVTFAQPPVLVNSEIKPRFDYFVQTRTQAILTSGWGGLQNLANIYGTKITALDLTFTPKKAGNTVVLTWSINGECINAAETVYLVTRTPNTGVGAGVAVALPNSVDASNNTWSGVTIGYDGDNATTPNTVTVKIVDFNTLDVSCTYSVHFRAANNRTSTQYLNRSINTAGSLDVETGMSLGHAHEIYV
jgi:hypothetical protein